MSTCLIDPAYNYRISVTRVRRTRCQEVHLKYHAKGMGAVRTGLRIDSGSQGHKALSNQGQA